MNYFTSARIKKDFPDAVERSYGAGQIVVYHGDRPDRIMIIKSGVVKFYDTDSNGNEKIMHISGKGSVFPLFYTFENKDHVDGFYETLTEAELILVPLAEFRNKLKSTPEFAFEIVQWYATQMDHILVRLRSLEKSNAHQKVLHALLHLASNHAEKISTKWYRTNFPVTQQTLADLSGLTRETVNSTLRSYNNLTRKADTYLEIDLEAVREQLDV